MTEPNSIEAIEARANAATAGPWMWCGNTDVNDIHLRSMAPAQPGRNKWERHPTIMRFERWGMQQAKPVFNDPDNRAWMLPETKDLVVYQVCPDATSRDDPRVYRGDIVGIRHPDAEFIAHARNDIDWLLARVKELEAALAAASAAEMDSAE